MAAVNVIDDIVNKLVSDIKGKTSPDASEIVLNLEDHKVIFKIVNKLLTDKLPKLGKTNRFKLTTNKDKHSDNTIIIISPIAKELDHTKWYNEVKTIINSVFYRKDNLVSLMEDSTYTSDSLCMMYKNEEYAIEPNIVVKSEPVFKVKRRAKTDIKVSDEIASQINEVVSGGKVLKVSARNLDDSDGE